MPTVLTRLTTSTLSLTLGLALCAAGVASRPAHAADWPTRPVHVIVPYGPGGTADTLGRIAAMKLSQALHQQFIVENKPGAGGLLGADIVERINAAVIQAFKQPDVRKLLAPDAIDPEPLTPAQFTAFFKAEAARWTPFARASGAKAD